MRLSYWLHDWRTATRLDAYRALVTAPRDHADQGKIGRRVLWATSDGREKLTYTVRVLRAVLTRPSGARKRA